MHVFLDTVWNALTVFDNISFFVRLWCLFKFDPLDCIYEHTILFHLDNGFVLDHNLLEVSLELAHYVFAFVLLVLVFILLVINALPLYINNILSNLLFDYRLVM